MNVRNYLSVMMVTFLSMVQFSCGGQVKEKQTDAAITVKTMTISPVEIATDKTYIGTVEESEGTQLSFQVPGNVRQVLVSAGDRVRKGQLLATLDKSRLHNNYLAAQTSLNQAQDAFDRMKVMYDSKSLPEIKFVEAKSALEMAKASAAVAKKDLEDCDLYAPFSGVIGFRNVEQGTNVGAGLPMLSVLKIDRVKIKVSVPEKEIVAVSQGDNALVFIKALGKRYSGKVAEKGVMANPLSHAYDLKVELDNAKAEIMPGMSCEVKLNNNSAFPGYILPVSAIQITSDNQRYVWVVEDGHTVRLRPVTVGKPAATGVIVLDGLHDGEEVVVDGFQKVYEGSAVKVERKAV